MFKNELYKGTHANERACSCLGIYGRITRDKDVSEKNKRGSKEGDCILFHGKKRCIIFVSRNNIHLVIATVISF